MKAQRHVKLFPVSFIFRLVCRARRRNHLKGKSAVRSFCAGSHAGCNPKSFRARPVSDKAAVPEPDYQSLQISFWAKTSMDEAPESDEASPMAQILVWASLSASKSL
jgi:hypothetical protein